MISSPVRQPSPGPMWETLKGSLPNFTHYALCMLIHIILDVSSGDELEEEDDQLGLPGTGGSRKRKEQRAVSGNNAKRPRFGLAAEEGQGSSMLSTLIVPVTQREITPSGYHRRV